MKNYAKKIIVHHTAVSRAKASSQFYAVDRYHRSLLGESVRSSLGMYGGYHLFIEPNGTVLRYREDAETGAHTIGENTRSIGVCLAGNFDVEYPTNEQLASLRTVLREELRLWNIQPAQVFPHRAFNKNKSCYGSKLTEDWARNLVTPEDEPYSTHEAELLARVSHLDLPREMLLRIVRALINLRNKI